MEGLDHLSSGISNQGTTTTPHDPGPDSDPVMNPELEQRKRKHMQQQQQSPTMVRFWARRTDALDENNSSYSHNDNSNNRPRSGKKRKDLHGFDGRQESAGHASCLGSSQQLLYGPCTNLSEHHLRRLYLRMARTRLHSGSEAKTRQALLYAQRTTSLQLSPYTGLTVALSYTEHNQSALVNSSSNHFGKPSVGFDDSSSRQPIEHEPELDLKPLPGSAKGTPATSAASSEHHSELSASSIPSSPSGEDPSQDLETAEVEALLQPQTRPITREQLVVEVKTIYEVVVQFEDKAIRINEEHSKMSVVGPHVRKPMSKDDYMSYIAIHKALLHEHHDLCLAAQHPAGTDSLKQLPARYSIPARMWRHGVHTPLETLRTLLPASREHMIAFILISFNHMTLFLETVPQFEATWLECIGDLGRYRLALADTEEEREIFTGIAQYWYARTIRLNPRISRLYHHCAVLAPALSLEQLSLYGRALTGISPFLSTRKSIASLFHPILADEEQSLRQISSPHLTLMRAHAALAIGGQGSRADFERSVCKLRNGHFRQIFNQTKQNDMKMKIGVHIAIISLTAMLQYGVTGENGSSASIFRLALSPASDLEAAFEPTHSSKANPFAGMTMLESLTPVERNRSTHTFRAACTLGFTMLADALQTPNDESLLPMIHVFFLTIWKMVVANVPILLVEDLVPWVQMAAFLNVYSNAASMTKQTCSVEFPENAQPVQEDHMIMGLIIGERYLESDWMENSGLDLSEQDMELDFMPAARLQRILWLGHTIARIQKWLTFDGGTRQFRIGLSPKENQIGIENTDFVPLLL